MARRRYDDWYERRPRIPADGIRAKSQRGAFGETWWAKRWIGVLENFGWGARLTRGRSYARNGAVLSLEIAPGQVAARVQGSRPKPYNVTIRLAPLSEQQWEQAIDAMAEQAIFAAKLLAGEMPQEIEEAFKVAGVPLFPRSDHDLTTQCSCPDYANPCKHIAAVYYLLGERFDEDPFLLFDLRGRGQQQIIEALRARRADSVGAAAPAPELAEPLASLADLLDSYYLAGEELAQIEPRIGEPQEQAALLRRYGAPPAGIEADLRAIYQAISAGVRSDLA
jgi:uncharacterized Zn finger protein